MANRETRTLELGQIALHCEIWKGPRGLAPPLVLLHGLWGDWRSFSEVCDALSEDRWIYAIDLRGHGLSGKPPRGYQPQDYVQDLVGALTRLDEPVLDAFGFCVGGYVALALAAAFPQRIRRCVLQEIWDGSVDPAQMQMFLALKRRPVADVIEVLSRMFPRRSRAVIEDN